MGVLSGFDRLVFRGVLRGIMDARGMAGFLYGKHVLLKDFGPYAEQTTRDVVEKSLEAARRLGREVRYLESSRTRKEDVASAIDPQLTTPPTPRAGSASLIVEQASRL